MEKSLDRSTLLSLFDKHPVLGALFLFSTALAAIAALLRGVRAFFPADWSVLNVISSFRAAGRAALLVKERKLNLHYANMINLSASVDLDLGCA